MSDQLLSYFERELAYIRRALDAFGNEFPEHAANMRLNQLGQEDPNVSRLIDAIALLTAKTEKRIDEQFPEILQDLFQVLYPGYLDIMPSYAPFKLNAPLDKIGEAVTLPKGSELSVSVNNTDCLFTLIDDLNIQPYDIVATTATSAPFNFPTPATLRRTDAVIRVTLSTSDPTVWFSHLDLDHVDLYVRGFENSSRGLVDLLLLNTEVMSILDEQGQQVVVDASRLKSRVTDPNFQWLPHHGSHFAGFDLLRDYFAYPDKAAYLRIQQLGHDLQQFDCATLTLNVFVQKLPVEFLRLFNTDVFSLHTVPAINLFSQHGEPIRYDFTQLSMPVVADVSQQDELTVVSVSHVSEVLPTGEVALSPLYQGGFWFDEYAPRWQVRQSWDEKGRRCMDIALSYTELDADKEDVMLSLKLKVCHGRLPCLIPSQTLSESLAAIDLPGALVVLKTPTAPQYPALDNQLGWRFIHLLNANFSSLMQTETPTRALQDAIRLCTHSLQCDLADAIKQVTYHHRVAPLTIDGHSIFASGTEVTILLDDTLLDSDFAVVSQVLNVFFQQYCSFDRFIQVTVSRFGSDAPGVHFDKCHGSQLCL